MVRAPNDVPAQYGEMHSGQTVPRFCEANQGFGQRRLLPDDEEAKRVLLSLRGGPRALELE